MTEGRYLLSGASDASAAVYDIQRATEYEGGSLVAKHKSIFVVDKQHEHGHKYAISSAIWYPIDTGLFITGSYDHYINVWDTNTTQVFILPHSSVRAPQFTHPSRPILPCSTIFTSFSGFDSFYFFLFYFIGSGEF